MTFILSQVSPGAKAGSHDISLMVEEGGAAYKMEWSFAEPSGGAERRRLISDAHAFQMTRAPTDRTVMK